MDKPLRPPQAKKLISKILDQGTVWYSKHAKERMLNRRLCSVDRENVLRGGIVEEPEFEEAWRYKVRTPRYELIIVFESEDDLRVISLWQR